MERCYYLKVEALYDLHGYKTIALIITAVTASDPTLSAVPHA
jgi:hypothetical protein